MTRSKHPQARNENIVAQPVGDELLVYDQTTDRAHALDAVAAFVFQRSDGRTSIAELAEALPATLCGDDAQYTVGCAVECLTDADLLASNATNGSPRFRHRRTMLKQAAMAGGLTATSYTLLSLIAPTPAQAQASDFGSGPGEGDVDPDPTLKDPTYPNGEPSGQGGFTSSGAQGPSAAQGPGNGSPQQPPGGPGDSGVAQVPSSTQGGGGATSSGPSGPSTTGSTPDHPDPESLASLSAEGSAPGGGAGGGGAGDAGGSGGFGAGGAGGGGSGSGGQSAASSTGTGTTSGGQAGPSAGGSSGTSQKLNGRRIC